MEHKRIYNRPLPNSNYFILNQNENTTEWVSYHLIPDRVKLEIELGIPVRKEEEYAIGEVRIEFDYSVDEKSTTKKINDWLNIEEGKYTNKILGIVISCNQKCGKDSVQHEINKLIKQTSLIVLKLPASDEALAKSYHGIAKILVRISEDLKMRELPEVTEEF